MRYLIVVLALLSGCALFQKAPLSNKQYVSCANPSSAVTENCNAAVDIFEKTNLLVAAINTAIDDNFNSKLLTLDQVKGYRARTKQADVELDAALLALNKFNYSEVISRANATKFLLDALNREVAAQIAKGAK